MADGHFPTLVSKDENANLVSNPLFVKLTDGSTALSVTGTSLDVNLTNTSVAHNNHAQTASDATPEENSIANNEDEFPF